METYINEIAKYLLSNNVVLFIGAGFSREFGYPGWGELLCNIIKKFNMEDELKNSTLFIKFNKEKFDNYKEINKNVFEELKGVDYLRLADYIDFLIQKQNVIEGKNQTIKTAIIEEINEYENKRVNNDKIDKIRNFFDKYKEYLEEVVTTNYDTNIEYCFNGDVSVIHRGYDSLNSIEKRNKVYKIHGCMNDQNKEIVITERDYQNFLLKNRYLFYKVFSLLTEKKLVFLGYSINDPNIRSLLNEIRYESKDEVNLEVYWINYDKVNVLDKEYYEIIHNIKIVENINIVDFFERLEVRVEKNKEIKNTDRQNIDEVAAEYRNNFDDKVYINEMLCNSKIINSENKEDVLKKLYVNIIDNRDRWSINPFLYLFLISEDTIQNKLKLNIQNILEDKSITIFYIIQYIEQDSEEKLYNYLNNSGLIDIFVRTSIEYCKGNHAFGEYGRAILICFKLIELFREKYIENRMEILRSLAKNINKSSKTKWLGYDWNALYDVERCVKILPVEDVSELIRLVSIGSDFVRHEQINAIVDSYNFSDIEKNKIRYYYFKKTKITNEVMEGIKEVLDRQFELEDVIWFKEYRYKYDENNIVFTIDEDEDSVEYKITCQETFKILQKFDAEIGKCQLIITYNGNCENFENDQIDDIIILLEGWLIRNGKVVSVPS